MPSMHWFPSYNIAWLSKTNQTSSSSFFNRKRAKYQPTVSLNNKTAVENTINNSQTKGRQNENSNSRYGQSLNGQNQTNPQRWNLNGSRTNQFFRINQSPDAPKKTCMSSFNSSPFHFRKEIKPSIHMP